MVEERDESPVSKKSFRVLILIVALLPFAGCSASTPSPLIPDYSRQQSESPIPAALLAAAYEARPFHRISAPAEAKSGIYVSAPYDTSILGFKSGYKGGRGPMCTIFTDLAVATNIAADSAGNLIVPRRVNDTVAVYNGPTMCGPERGEFRDPYGPPVNAASLNAATGLIVLANQHGRGHLERRVGSIALCTLKRCMKKLTSANVTGYGFGVALAKNGDCWLTSENASFTGAAMTYWPGCTGSGEAVTGFMNASYGSLSIDKAGNLVSVDIVGGGAGQLWVYSGCSPACTVVGGPFPLHGNPIAGTLNAKGDTFGTMETPFPYGGNVDIYRYSPTSLTYKYSFDSSFAPVADPEGITYSPALEQ
jgi:hypothetical protein